MRVYHCNKCKISVRLENDKDITQCPKCRSKYIVIYNNKKINGGTKMGLTEEQKAHNMREDEKFKSDKKEKGSITTERIKNAEKIIEFMKNDLNIEQKDLTKVLSRCYNIAKNKK